MRVSQTELWEPIRALATSKYDAEISIDPLRGVVRIRPPNERSIDVVVGRLEMGAARHRTRRVDAVEGRHLPTVTTADLILLKLAAGGPQDAWDMTSLLEVAPEKSSPRSKNVCPTFKNDAKELWQRIRQRRLTTSATPAPSPLPPPA